MFFRPVRVAIPAMIFVLGGCGGSGPSARITQDPRPGNLRAQVDWNIAKDIEDKKIDYILPPFCASGWCHAHIDLPKSLIGKLVELAKAVKIGKVEMASPPRPVDVEKSDKWFIFEKVNLEENDCSETRIFIEYRDSDVKGIDWLKSLPSVTIDESKLEPVSRSFDHAWISFNIFPKLTWYVKRCPKALKRKNQDYGLILYKDENYVSVTNPNLDDD